MNLTLYTGEDKVGERVSHQGLFDESYRQDGVLSNEGFSLYWNRLWTPNFETTLRSSVSRYESDFFTQELDWDDWLARYEQSNGIPALPYLYLDSTINTRLENVGTEIEATWQVSPEHQLRFGVSKAEKSIASRETAYYLDSPFTDLQETDLSSTFIQDQWQVSEWFSTLLGVRFVDNSLSETNFTEPRLSFKIGRNKSHWSLRGSWGEYHQHLLRSPDNLNYFAGIETWFLAFGSLEPGKSKQAQLGGSWKYKNWNVDIEFFRRDQRGSLFRIYEPVGNDFSVHQSKDRIKGVDLLIHQKRGSFSSYLGLQLSGCQGGRRCHLRHSTLASNGSQPTSSTPSRF